MLRRWIAPLVCALVLALPSMAQVGGFIAYVQDGEVFLLGPSGTAQVTQTEQEYEYVADLRWSADGSQLAFTKQIEFIGADGYPSYRMDLFVINPNDFPPGSAPQPLTARAEGLAAGFPPAWGQDGALYFVRDNASNLSATSPGDFLVDIFRLPVGGSVESVASVPFGVGCGGGTSEPNAMLYNGEAGFGGNAVAFLATRYGLVLSTNYGGTGLNLLAPDGTLTRLSDTLARVALAPDGRTLAALELDYSVFPPMTKLYTYDLETRTAREIASPVPADQVGWGGDGALYISSSTAVGELFSVEETTQIGIAQGFDMSLVSPEAIPSYRVTVHRIDLASGSSEEVAAHDGSFVGRLRPAPGGIAYSLIGSLETWGRGLLDGSIDPLSESYFQDWESFVSLESFIVANGSSSALGRLAQMELAP